jgi:TPR repeat protein
MGIWYSIGYLDVKPDQKLAVEWFRKAAEQGMVMAQYNLAMLLHPNPKETYFWLSVALPHLTGQTLQNGTRARAIAAAALKPDERAQLDERVRQWHPSGVSQP